VSHRVSSIGLVCASVLFAAFCLPAAASAQAQTELVPFFASYYALSPYGTNIPEDTSGTLLASERMSNAPAIGVRLAVAVTRIIAIEGQVAYTPSGRQVSFKPNVSIFGFYLRGHELLASGRLAFHPRRSNFRLIAGVGYLARGGDGWDEKNFPAGVKFDKSIIGGVAGFGARANLTPHLSLDLDVEAFMYSSDADLNGPTFKSKFQQDILVSIGVPIKLGR